MTFWSAFDLLLTPPTTMKATSSTQQSQVISLLQEGFSLCQIQQKTGLGKSTVGRIKKQLDDNKENLRGGHPSKLSTWDKTSIICQITTGKLDTAVQASKFINPALSSPVVPQTICNMLKQEGLCSITKTKCPLLKKKHCIH